MDLLEGLLVVLVICLVVGAVYWWTTQLPASATPAGSSPSVPSVSVSHPAIAAASVSNVPAPAPPRLDPPDFPSGVTCGPNATASGHWCQCNYADNTGHTSRYFWNQAEGVKDGSINNPCPATAGGVPTRGQGRCAPGAWEAENWCHCNSGTGRYFWNQAADIKSGKMPSPCA